VAARGRRDLADFFGDERAGEWSGAVGAS
jgi:hypothetical protein